MLLFYQSWTISPQVWGIYTWSLVTHKGELCHSNQRILKTWIDDLNQSRDMFEDTFALDEPQEEEAQHTPAHNMDDEQPLLEDTDPDTDSASEDDTNRYGLRPFLLAKFKDQTMDIQGDAFW